MTASCGLVESLGGLTGDAGPDDPGRTQPVARGTTPSADAGETSSPADGAVGEAAPDAAVDSAGQHGRPVDSPPEGPTSVYRAAVLSDTPLAYWRLGEASGTVAHDETGNGHDGRTPGRRQLGVAGALTGNPDTALHLDGTSCVVDVGEDFDFAGQAPFTLEDFGPSLR